MLNTIDKIFDVGRARPDIVDGANFLPGAETLVHVAEKTRLAAAKNPRGPNDVTSRAGSAHRLFAGDFGPTVNIDRLRFVFDGVGRATDRLAFEGILRAEVNDLGADCVRRFGEKPRPVDVHRLGFGRDSARIRRPAARRS